MTCSQVHIPHVTGSRRELCGCTSDGLIEFGGAMPYYPPKDRAVYLLRGQWIHAAANMLVQGMEPPIERTLEAILRLRRPTMPDLDVSGWPLFLDGVRTWLSLRKVDYVSGEVEVTHPTLMYRGRYDLKAWVDDKLSRIDWKTGTTMPKYTPLQLALYDMAELQYTNRIGILLKPDGKFEEYGPGKEPPYTSFADYAHATALATWYWGSKQYK